MQTTTGTEFVEMVREKLMGDFYNPDESIKKMYKKIKKYFVSYDYKVFRYIDYLRFVSLLNSYIPFEDNEKLVLKLFVKYIFKLNAGTIHDIDYELSALILKRFFESQKKYILSDIQIRLLINLCDYHDIDIKDLITRFYKGDLFVTMLKVDYYIYNAEDYEYDYDYEYED